MDKIANELTKIAKLLVADKRVPLEKAKKILIEYAKEGERIVLNGKKLWMGLGNRSGLHSYANTLLNEKWKKSGPNFIRNLEKLLSVGERVEILTFKNIDREKFQETL